MSDPHYVYFEDQLAHRQRLYINPREIVVAHTADEVEGAIARLQSCQRGGLYLAGYFAYELGLLLEPALVALIPQNFKGPFLQFGVFDGFERVPLPYAGKAHIEEFSPAWDQEAYAARFAKLMAYIRAGDAYQINLSFPVSGRYEGSAAALYHLLKTRQPVSYGGVVCLGGDVIVSLSPELFFETEGKCIRMRPMKGTCGRGDTPEADEKLAKMLQGDEKNRAENLMIVDLLRNDMSRLSKAGSVQVSDLFSIETYPTLHTMTSGIEAQLNADVTLRQMLSALFPCGSVTGAPKIRAMEIIDELEGRVRGAYCGAHGVIDPNGDMRFNVGIRTLSLKPDGRYVYPVGSGVVADSDPVAEYEECLLKAQFLQDPYQLIETMGWDEKIGFMHLDLHLGRLQKSASVLGFLYDEDEIMTQLNLCVARLNRPYKVRLVLSKHGQIEVSAEELMLTTPDEEWPVALCENRRDSSGTLLAHKTTKRSFIEGEWARLNAQTGCREVLFFNEKDEVCEGSYTNVFVLKDGHMFTPPISSGLLPGVLRQVLIANGEASERVLTLEDVQNADAVYIGNSVRGLIRARLVSTQTL
ncbi:MAG: aminodeoxychorismate synthase, component I [Robiginitomaculum sp.]|nr:MAG: aminodeoxychorismate synthase, component I [Robiginitomaculum sp.]